jgi:thioesterase domain-containing protein/acyl carrier protein
MVLDDRLIAELDERRVRTALDPKMAGAWNLHKATQRLQLDHFVCFSSFSSVVGMIRQANYNAGNAFLDSLARYRRARHLPALTVNWGVIRGAGYVERTRNTAETLARAGVGALQADEALRALDELLVRDAAQVAAARIDWNAVLKLSPLAAASRAYAPVIHETRTAEATGSLVSQLRVAAVDEQERLLQTFIAEQVAGVFGTSEDRIDRTARLTDLGLDSLMTLELTNRVDRGLGIRVPVGALLSGPTIAELARSVRDLLAPVLATADGAAGDTAGSTPHASVSSSDPSGHIVIVKNGTGVPVFCFHPVGGGVGIYAALGDCVPDDLPLYGVESRVVRGDREYESLQYMVDAYVTAVRAAHPGPYRLLGFSLGGYLAGRVAAVLESHGAPVEFVGVLDWDAGQQITPMAQREGLVRLAVASYVFLQQEMGILLPRSEHRLHHEISALVDQIAVGASGGGEAFFEWVIENQLTASAALEDLARQYLVRFEQHCRLLTHGLPQPRFSAPLIVWRAQHGFGSGVESWDRGNGTLDREHIVEGDHNALMRPAALERVGAQLVDFMQTVSGAHRAEVVAAPHFT